MSVPAGAALPVAMEVGNRGAAGRRGAVGFTLLEVLVALAVLAIGLGAVIRLAGSSAETLALLRDRTFAHWVAGNRLNELLLASEWPALGGRAGQARLGGRRWRWRQQITATSDAGLRRLQVTVWADGGPAVDTAGAAGDAPPGAAAPLAEQVAFRGRN